MEIYGNPVSILSLKREINTHTLLCLLCSNSPLIKCYLGVFLRLELYGVEIKNVCDFVVKALCVCRAQKVKILYISCYDMLSGYDVMKGVSKGSLD